MRTFSTGLLRGWFFVFALVSITTNLSTLAQGLVVPPSSPRRPDQRGPIRTQPLHRSFDKGTELAVHVAQQIDQLRIGSTLETHLVDPVGQNEGVQLPRGTAVRIEVVDWQPAGNGRDGELVLGLRDVLVGRDWRPAKSDLLRLRVPFENPVSIPVDLIGNLSHAGEVAGLYGCPEHHEIEAGARRLADDLPQQGAALIDRVVLFRLADKLDVEP